jgi:Mrp family chromosome partitioning ATPase
MSFISTRRPTPVTGANPGPPANVGERRAGRGVWLAARTRNALRRSALLAIVGGVTFMSALLALVLVPRRANQAALVVAPRPEERPDTAAAGAAVARASRAAAAAEQRLAEARRAAVTIAAVAAPPVDTFPPEAVARREQLARRVGALNVLIRRTEDAPLPASYRALGGSPEVAGDPRARALLDSLATIEREREALNAVGGVDPVFIALTSRAAEVGRDIRAVAEERRVALRREYATLRPAPAPARPSPALLARADTAAAVARVVAARQAVGRATGEVAAVRQRAAEYAAREAQARALANIGIPPLALLAAALVLGAAVAFAASLATEVVHPRVADAREAERVADTRVLATIRPGAPLAERGRRRTDVEAPPLIEIASESYRMLYLNFAATGAAVPLLTMTGDEPRVVATVAANLAAASAYDARSTLLVDADPAAGAVAGVFRLRTDPGYVDVLRGAVDWAEAIVSTHVGRDGTIDVVPSGTVRRGEQDVRVGDQTRRDFARLVTRYDLGVLVVPLVHAARESGALMPVPDTILCVRVGHTRLSTLAEARERLQQAGMHVVGLVMWDAEEPNLPSREAIAAARWEMGRTPPRGAEARRPAQPR